MPLLEQLGPRATLKPIQDADHSFHLPARGGHKDSDARAELVDALADWMETAMGETP